MTLPERPSLVLLRETWGHMSEHSGFDPLFTAINAYRGDCASFFVPNTVPAPGWVDTILHCAGLGRRGRSAVANPDYMQPRHVWAAREVLTFAQKYRDSVVFLSAAENQYCHLLSTADAALRRRLILCLHQPPSWLKLHWRDFSALDGVGALICLSEEQRGFLAARSISPVHRIRHGVRHDFFLPPQDSRGRAVAASNPRLLCVGHWLRDFETLHESMQLLWERRPEVELDCVIPWQARNLPVLVKLARDSRVRWHAGLPPETLRDLYQNATLLLLPLLDAAANNAVVEAMACGLPVVTSDVGGVREYVPAGGATLCPAGDAQAHAVAVLAWLADPERRGRAGAVCRDFAESELDWPAIAAGLLTVLGLSRG